MARNHLLFEDSRLCVVVCDGTNPERGLPLVLQVLEITPRVIVCLNLMDEAKKKGVETDTEILSSLLGVPVICTSARNKKSLSAAAEAIAEGLKAERATPVPPTNAYPQCLEESVSAVEAAVEAAFEEVGASADKRIPARFIALRLLEGNTLVVIAFQKPRVSREGSMMTMKAAKRKNCKNRVASLPRLFGNPIG